MSGILKPLPDASCNLYQDVARNLRQRNKEQLDGLRHKGHPLLADADQGVQMLGRWLGEDPANFFQRMGALCSAYLKDSSSYSVEAQKALARIRPILANGLITDMRVNPDKSGFDLKTTWLRSHPEVYAEQGVFGLPIADQWRIVRAAGPALLQYFPVMPATATGGAVSSAWDAYVKKIPRSGRLTPPYRAASDRFGLPSVKP